jgi:hypothetical protein
MITCYPSKQAAEDLCLRSWTTTTAGFSNSNFENWAPQYQMHSTPNGGGDSEMLCSFRISVCYRLLSFMFQNQITNPSCLAFWTTLQQGKSWSLWKNWLLELSQSYNASKLVSTETRIICFTWNANNCDVDRAMEAWDKVQFCQIRDIDSKFQDSLYNSWQYSMSHIAQFTVFFSWEYK